MKWIKLAVMLSKYTAARLFKAARFRASRICKKFQR